MILNKITLNNFRQFRGLQEIEFAKPSEKEKGSVTIIFGENGRGKTGIFRAIMFALYGDHRLSQDAHVKKDELILVNIAEMQNSSKAANPEPVECFVELDFSHKKNRYILNRRVIGFFSDGNITEELGTLKLTKIENGNTSVSEDPKEIDRIINSILDGRVREYFLFDGEKIEKLTRASIEQRKEISRGLRNLLNIDNLEIAKNSTLKLKKKLDSELEKKSTGDYAKILNQLKVNEDKRNTAEKALAQNDIESEKAASEKRHLDKELEKIHEIVDLLKDRNSSENREKELNEQLNGYLLEMRNLSGKLSLPVLANTVDKIFNYVDIRIEKGEIPSEIRRDLIDKLLDNKECICGRAIEFGSESFKKVIDWKNKANELVIDDTMLELWRSLSTVRSHYSDIISNGENILQKYAVTKEELEQSRKIIEELNNRIGSDIRSDAGKLQKLRGNVEEKLVILEAEHQNLLSELEILNNEQIKLQAQRKEKEIEQGIRDELTIRASIASNAYDALSEVHTEFTEEIKNAIGISASQYFSELIDSQGKETLKKIIVNDDYSLQILDKWNKPFLANISAGQRQIMSIAYIAALAEAAAKDKIFEMPFFMDSPFGRLSNKHRKNLIKTIPKFANQWILLATDTEFRRSEARAFSETGYWKKFYILRGKGAGITELESCDVDKAFSYLKEEYEVIK